MQGGAPIERRLFFLSFFKIDCFEWSVTGIVPDDVETEKEAEA